MSRLMRASVLFLLSVTATVGCAHTHSLGPAYIFFSRSDQPEIELRSYSFSPDHLVILDDHSPVTLRLINIADTGHNFTLLDPEKGVIVSKNLNSEESATISLNSLGKGNYVFYCNRFRHRHRGMEGMLMID